MKQENAMDLKTIYLAGGCFWGTEKYLSELEGVVTTEVGYANGRTENPSYEDVCYKNTGHAETVKAEYDASILPLKDLLKLFYEVIDPVSINRQGNDVGTQYRSAIFPLNAVQQVEAEAAMSRNQANWPSTIVTTIEEPTTWYPAEDYHQEYWQGEGQRNPYCLAVIPPKLQKLRKSFAARVKA